MAIVTGVGSITSTSTVDAVGGFMGARGSSVGGTTLVAGNGVGLAERIGTAHGSTAVLGKGYWAQVDYQIPVPKAGRYKYVPDIRLVQNAEFPNEPWYAVTIDWMLLGDGTLDDRDALASAVIVALGTDRLADESDLLPDPDSSDRRGWWGDFDADLVWNGWEIGCRLWTLQRDKIDGPGSRRGSTVVRVENYIREAIQPFVDRRMASSFSVKAHRVGKERIDALVQIFRGNKRPIDLRYQILWSGIEREGFPIQEYITD